MDMKGLTKGADLTTPKASVGWVVSASVAVMVLMVAVGIGGWLFGKAKNATGGMTKSAGSIVEGAFGDGQT